MSLISWDEAIIPIFFVYGLAFYSMGLALIVESGRASELGFARSMRLLAGFGLLHGIHEWLEMFERGLELYYQSTFPAWVLWIRLAIFVTSLLALVAFGEHLLARSRHNRDPNWRLTIGAVGWYAISCIMVKLTYNLNDLGWMNASEVLSRYILGIPGGVLACLALWHQRTVFREQGMGRFVRDLTIAAVALAAYGVIGQSFSRPSEIFPSQYINTAVFLRLIGFPIQLFRAMMAAVVAVSMIRVLRALEVENQQRLDAAEQAQRSAEQLSREELARLNTELQAANQETERLLHEVRKRDSLRGELLQRITAAQESERQRIARELHDGTGQALTGLALGLRGVAAQLDSNAEQVGRRLPILETMATNALGELRHLINDLRPPQLDDMGLAAALRWMVERFKDQEKPLVRLEVQGDPSPLSTDVETTLFRIAQEGLTNATKHAQASHVWIRLSFLDGVTLIVQDDGIGFDTEATLDATGLRTGWGLAGIQERANLINAALALDSRPNEGTTLTIYVKPQEIGADYDDSDSHH